MKKGPILLLSTLVVTLVFILGVQYGKRVKVADEAIKELLKQIPSPTVTPTPGPENPPYKSLQSKRCGFSFVYPETYSIEVTSTYAAHLQENGKDVIAFSCDPALDLGFPEREKYSSSPAELAGASSVRYSSDVENWIEVHTTHPTKDIPLSIGFAQDIQPLIEQSFKFSE